MNEQTTITPPANVYAAIAQVQGEIAKEGIGKNRKAQGYDFRGIDDVYNALAPLLSSVGLCVLPRILSRDLTERKTSSGKPMFFVTVEAEFDFVCAADGSMHTVRTYGEAMDMSDKATNKAMSAAYKYAAFMTFAIPTEGDGDSDGAVPEGAMPEEIRERILGLCKKISPDQEKRLKDAYRVESIPQLTQAQALRVIEKLEDKVAQKAKEQSNAQAETASA